MRGIWLSIKANLYKMLHARLLWLHILLPALAAVAFVAYDTVSPIQEAEKVKLYLQVLAIVFPLMIAIVTTMVYEADLHAGSFQLFRMLPENKAKGHVGNLSGMLLLGGLASAVAVMGFGILFQKIMPLFFEASVYRFPTAFYGKAFLLLFNVNIAGYMIQYIICYTLGKGVSLGMGIMEMLLGTLLYLGIGDTIWKGIPCSYGIRMISYYVIKSTPEQGMLSCIMDEYQTGGRVILFVTLSGSVLFWIWGTLWQGDKTNTE